MTREQRFKYEMFVRVRDYGTANSDLFPSSSTGHETFGRVTTAVAVIDDHLKNRVLARAEARKVKAVTRAAVFNYMKTLALAARRVTRLEPGINPFRLPSRRSLKVEISTARAFIEEAEKRQEQFVRLGLPATFVSEFRTLVNQLQQAVDVRLNSKTVRGKAQAGIRTALADGLEAIRDLDAIVAIATRQDPTRFAAWQSARRIEGQGSASSSSKATSPAAVTIPAAVPAEPKPVNQAPEPAFALGRAS
jgi:hypothetical protein